MPVKPTLIAIALAGCITETTHPVATVTAHWAIQALATGLPTGCPAGFEIARLIAQPADGGAPATTDLPCAAGLGESAALDAGVYAVSIAIVDAEGAVYARSIPGAIDLSSGRDQRLDTTILADAGYGQLAWTFVGATTGAALDCDAGIDAIVVSATVGTTAYVDQLPCGPHAGLTRPLPAGGYTFFVTASQLGQGIGTAITASGQVIDDRNRITDLGSLQIAIAGK